MPLLVHFEISPTPLTPWTGRRKPAASEPLKPTANGAPTNGSNGAAKAAANGAANGAPAAATWKPANSAAAPAAAPPAAAPAAAPAVAPAAAPAAAPAPAAGDARKLKRSQLDGSTNEWWLAGAGAERRRVSVGGRSLEAWVDWVASAVVSDGVSKTPTRHVLK